MFIWNVLACECNPEGSATQQCNQTTGHCICMLGIGGEKCDSCARGYLGKAPNCSPCGECFENWDQTQKELSGKYNSWSINIKDIRFNHWLTCYIRTNREGF